MSRFDNTVLYTANIAPSGFFVLRSPLLPVEKLIKWSALNESATSPLTRAQWNSAIYDLRESLNQLVAEPELRQALFIASPTLESALSYWLKDPTSKKGLQFERSLVRYIFRMATRCTPFGLCSGCSIGYLGSSNHEKPALELKSTECYTVAGRLDYEYIFAVMRALGADPGVSDSLRYFPNSTLRLLGDAWHYIETRPVPNAVTRSHHLIKVQADRYLNCLLATARDGITRKDLIIALSSHPEYDSVAEDAISEYVTNVIDSELLASSLAPSVTGKSPLAAPIGQLRLSSQGNHAADVLERVQLKLDDLHRHGLGASPDQYRSLATDLLSLPTKPDISRLFQVDLTKPFHAGVLPAHLVTEVLNTAQLLCELTTTEEPNELQTFRRRFIDRYEHAWVPLAQVLDDDIGIGFGETGQHPAGDDAIVGEAATPVQQKPMTPLHELLLRKLLERTTPEIVLQRFDFEALPKRKFAFPDTFDISFAIAAGSMTDFTAGNYTIAIKNSAGPSGVRLLGRFCHASEELEKAVRAHIAEEEKLDPDAVYAEIVHLPEGRYGNILFRPILREYEIPYMGRPGVDKTHQILLADILVTVSIDGQIILWSQKVNRRIIPRLSNAHGFFNQKFDPVYRFLCSLQNQGGNYIPLFDWGPLKSLTFLPRVTAGKAILSSARWRISQEEAHKASCGERYDSYCYVQQLRKRYEWPRWVVLVEFDNTLTIDLDNPLSVDSFVQLLKRNKGGLLTELYPPLDQLCASGPEGHYYSELLIPFVKRVPNSSSLQTKATINVENYHRSPGRSCRSFAPGSEWLYLKLYGGYVGTERVLVERLGPLLGKVGNDATDRRWFFLRYGDPDYHLRLRLHGDPQRLVGDVLPTIHAALAGPIESGQLWKIEIATYEREVERYGGPAAIVLTEEMFWRDSKAVLDLLASSETALAAAERLRIGIMGVDSLLSVFGYDTERRRDMMRDCRDAIINNSGNVIRVKRFLSERFRSERDQLARLLAPSHDSDELHGWRSVFAKRTTSLKPIVEQLVVLDNTRQLTVDLPAIVISHCHMFLNRLMREGKRTHELVVYDSLFRLYDRVLAISRRSEDPQV